MNQGMFEALIKRLDRIVDLLEGQLPLSISEQAAAKEAVRALQQGEADGTELPVKASERSQTKRSRT